VLSFDIVKFLSILMQTHCEVIFNNAQFIEIFQQSCVFFPEICELIVSQLIIHFKFDTTFSQFGLFESFSFERLLDLLELFSQFGDLFVLVR
jgi:hypothetical protein